MFTLLNVRLGVILPERGDALCLSVHLRHVSHFLPVRVVTLQDLFLKGLVMEASTRGLAAFRTLRTDAAKATPGVHVAAVVGLTVLLTQLHFTVAVVFQSRAEERQEHQ